MTQRLTHPPVRARANWPRRFPRRLLWAWILLAVGPLALAGAVPAHADSGEVAGAEGYYRPPTCTSDFTIQCDDRFAGDIVSCHMRDNAPGEPSATRDEGLAVKVCSADIRLIDEGFVDDGALEQNVTIQRTAFGQILCGREDETGDDFCLVCETFVDAGAGARECVRIVNNGDSLSGPSSCGAFTVTRGTSTECSTTQLRRTFSDPRLAFFVDIITSEAGAPGAKDLKVCGTRSWECDTNPLSSPLLAVDLQQPDGDIIIHTPICFKKATGGYICR